jgi:hypothetical protein
LALIRADFTSLVAPNARNLLAVDFGRSAFNAASVSLIFALFPVSRRFFQRSTSSTARRFKSALAE